MSPLSTFKLHEITSKTVYNKTKFHHITFYCKDNYNDQNKTNKTIQDMRKSKGL